MRLIALIVLGVILSFPAWGQASLQCASREHVVDWLKREYDEVPVARGTVKGNLVELFTSPDGNTWTIIATRPNGAACPVASGDGWETYPVKRGRAS